MGAFGPGERQAKPSKRGREAAQASQGEGAATQPQREREASDERGQNPRDETPFLPQIEEIFRRPFREFSTDEFMRLMKGDD